MPLTEQEAAEQAIASLTTLSSEQEDAKTKIDSIIASSDEIIDAHELFSLYNVLYFRSMLLPRVEVSWSPRLTLYAGICELVRDPNNGNKFTRIRLKLSESLLKYRPRRDVVDTLLHESIHAYFFVTTSWRPSGPGEDAGHGPGFLHLADAINQHGAYNITVYHTFHDEVDSYRTHIWQCDGPCKLQAPSFGLVKRAMNRAPSKSDDWWPKHQDECGGSFSKISEPDPTKKQLGKLSGLKRAGLQKTKIDGWINSGSFQGSSLSADQNCGPLLSGGKRQADSLDADSGPMKRPKSLIACRICTADVDMDDINAHLDQVHPDC